MTPHRLFLDLQHIAFLAGQAQDDIGKHVGKIVQPFEVQFPKLPRLEKYDTITSRTHRISQRNFALIKKKAVRSYEVRKSRLTQLEFI